jgi:hypothetical protein
MNECEFSKKMRTTATYCFISAGVVFALSFVAAFVIQDLLPGSWDLIGFIAYIGGPLPILPAVLIVLGILSLLMSSTDRNDVTRK